MANRANIKMSSIFASLFLVMLLASCLVSNLYVPKRKMFHNYLASVGEKGPFRFWVEPPRDLNTTYTQELFLDKHLNILVLVILEHDHNEAPKGRYEGGWTGHAHFDYDHTLFKYNGHIIRINRQDKDTLAILSPEGEKLTVPLWPDEASLWYEQITTTQSEDLLDDLKKAAETNKNASNMIAGYVAGQP